MTNENHSEVPEDQDMGQDEAIGEESTTRTTGSIEGAEPSVETGPGEGPAPKSHCFVVGVGASAGGLEALQEFFSHCPFNTGAAFVVVTHQHRGRTSLMADLLARHTDMPVRNIRSGEVAAPNTVFVAPPGVYVGILHGVLELMPEEATPIRLPIDYFFRSLAQDQGEFAVGIVLSGTGSDGSLGLTAIKGAGGMSMAQAEDSARYPGMPRSAIATGHVDFILPVQELPSQLIAYARGAHAREPIPEDEGSQGDLRRLMLTLRKRTSHDFSNYKPSTIRRRIQRRMNLHNLSSLDEYTRYMQTNPGEIDSLFQELLINVTSFFRDPDAFEALGSKALFELFADKADDYVFRVWVAGCSTGEEAYSLAILMREIADSLNRRCAVQIFATDLDPEAIETARAGMYALGIAQDVSEARLKRFFSRQDNYFRVNKDLREMIIFAPQNLLQDPPFTKLDLLSCRNLLIYLDTSLQRRLMPVFHYSLKPGGVLFLGSSENLGDGGKLFRALDKRWKIFARAEVPPNTYAMGFSTTARHVDAGTDAQILGLVPLTAAGQSGTTAQQADRLILRELVPPTVLCNDRGEILHIHGRTGAFLELAPGPQTANNLYAMAKDGLQLDLSAALRQASREQQEIVHRGVRFTSDEKDFLVDLRVRHIVDSAQYKGHFLVCFEDIRSAELPIANLEEIGTEVPLDRAAELIRELQHTRDVHQGTVEQLQSSNEELKSTNEELQSTNEELQSTNEELETSKEEMQSLNEELQTVNAELQDKLAELARVNDDMKNLLNGSDIATIFVDNGLCIKRYTDQVKNVANLIPGDIGRPLADLVSKLNYDQLITDAQEVLRTLNSKEVEVQGPDNSWYQVRVVPYRTTENVIEGLVMTFVDISKIKELQETERKMAQILEHSPVWVFGNDSELRYTFAGNVGLMGRTPGEVIGKRDEDFLPAELANPLRRIKEKALNAKSIVRELVDLPIGGVMKTYDLQVQPVMDADGQVESIAGVLSETFEEE